MSFVYPFMTETLVREQRNSNDSNLKPSIGETEKGGQGIPCPISPLPHALSANDGNSDDEDAWMVDIQGLRSLDPDASDFVYDRNEYVWHHEQFYRRLYWTVMCFFQVSWHITILTSS